MQELILAIAGLILELLVFFLCRKSADTDTENEDGSNHGTGLGISFVFCGF